MLSRKEIGFSKLLTYLTILLLGGLLIPAISYATLTLDSTSLTSDGALTLKSASSSAINFGHPDQSGTITIASTTQALTLDIGKSTSVLTISIGSGTGGHTVNIATGTSSAKTINIGTGADILNSITMGAASSTINLLGKIGIGVTSPSSTLHVSGTLRFIDGNQGAGKALFSDASGNATWQTASSTELTYNEATSTVSLTATTEASATVVVTADAYTFDGSTPVIIEFFAPQVSSGATADAGFILYLFEDGASKGTLAKFQTGNAAYIHPGPIEARRRLTPSSGSHTYSIRGIKMTASAQTVQAGPGGVGQDMPAFIRTRKAQ